DANSASNARGRRFGVMLSATDPLSIDRPPNVRSLSIRKFRRKKCCLSAHGSAEEREQQTMIAVFDFFVHQTSIFSLFSWLVQRDIRRAGQIRGPPTSQRGPMRFVRGTSIGLAVASLLASCATGGVRSRDPIGDFSAE